MQILTSAFCRAALSMIYPLALHDALPILSRSSGSGTGLPSLSRHVAADSSRSDKAERSEEHTSELQSPRKLVCRLLLEKKYKNCAVASRLAATPDGPHRPVPLRTRYSDPS